MDNEQFRKQIEKNLEKLDHKDVVSFAWRCAVYALPFLGSKGHFDFWKKDKQKHLFAVLNAIDISCGVRVTFADRVIKDVYDAATAIYDSDAAVVVATVTAVITALDTGTVSAYAAARAAPNAKDAAAAYATARASTVSKAIAASYEISVGDKSLQDEIQRIILQDVKEGKLSMDIRVYGDVWPNFIKALKNESCEYWAKLYTKIFESGFELDMEALKMRLNVPLEIRDQGAAAVANYLEEAERHKVKNLNQARIIILGDKGAGKTCLARRLKEPNAPMTKEHESTHGVEASTWKLLDGKTTAYIWDFAGHVITHAAHQFFLSERSLYIIVYNGRTESSNRLEYWLDHMKNYGGDSEAIILVNKFDEHTPDIPINSLRDKYPILKEGGFHIFSIEKDIEALDTLRKKVIDYIKEKPSWNSQIIPGNYYNVKLELEKLFVEDGEENITKEKFENIAFKNDIDNPQILLKNLDALGICLWYPDIEEIDALVLNPEWITYGVYKVINWVHEQKRHFISLNDFEQVFIGEETRYTKKQQEFIFLLMRKYELAYEYKSKEGRCLIIPHLLREDRPNNLPKYPIDESLTLRYKADCPLPPNTTSRFIIRHNEDILKKDNEYLVWRYGVVLNGGNDTLALVRREDDRTIEVSVKGRDKTAYISKLRETLNSIFNSYKSDKPELQYQIDRGAEIPQEINKINPLWVQDQQLLSHFINEQPLYDYLSNRYIPVSIVINNYNITGESTMIGGTGNIITRNTFNFKDCNIALQGELNSLARTLKRSGHEDVAKELENAAEDLKEAETITNPEEIKRKGLLGNVTQILEDLGNKDSKLHRVISGIDKGVEIAQKMGKTYNKIGQWAALPIIPDFFLGK